MVKNITLNEKPTKLKLVLSSPYKEKIWIKVKDADRPNTYYTIRYGFIEGKKEFVVLMPQAPERAQITIFNDSHGNIPNDSSFQLQEIKAIPYKKLLNRL